MQTQSHIKAKSLRLWDSVHRDLSCPHSAFAHDESATLQLKFGVPGREKRRGKALLPDGGEPHENVLVFDRHSGIRSVGFQ